MNAAAPSGSSGYLRDMVGYGGQPPDPAWPGGARIAVSFVLNYEEGAESHVSDGDQASEVFLCDVPNAQPYPDRHMSVESLYEYGSRSGFWRVMDLFARYRLPLTIFGVARAMQRNPAAVAAIVRARHEVACHGLRWISYQQVSPETERRHMAEAVSVIEQLTRQRPVGWYTGRDSPNTRSLVMEHGGFLYDSDSYADDLPYWVPTATAGHLVIPYALDTNDMRLVSTQGFGSGDEFFTYLKDAFDVLYREGGHAPKMMSVGLHGRIVGRPGRFASLERFVQHVTSHSGVWVARRADIAAHWIATHPFRRT